MTLNIENRYVIKLFKLAASSGTQTHSEGKKIKS